MISEKKKQLTEKIFFKNPFIPIQVKNHNMFHNKLECLRGHIVNVLSNSYNSAEIRLLNTTFLR